MRARHAQGLAASTSAAPCVPAVGDGAVRCASWAASRGARHWIRVAVSTLDGKAGECWSGRNELSPTRSERERSRNGDAQHRTRVLTRAMQSEKERESLTERKSSEGSLPSMDRAKLAARRQRLRLVEGAGEVGEKAKKRGSAATSNQEAAARLSAASWSESTSKRKSEVKPLQTETAVHNGALLVRQILQQEQYGDVVAFFDLASKRQLVEQLVVVAGYATELREKAETANEAAELAIHQQSARYQQVACDLVQRDSHIRDLEGKVAELGRSLKRADEEYKSLLRWIREKDYTWKMTDQARRDQAELIQGLSEVQKQREYQLHSISRDLEQSVRYVQELQTENEDLTQRLSLKERETERLEKEVEVAREKIQSTEWELNQKTQEFEGARRTLEDTKSEVLALRDELKVESVMRQAAIVDREKYQLQLEKEAREWRSKQDLWENSEQRTTQQIRRLDFELHHLKQVTSRLRAECEGERAQREKAETNALSLTRSLTDLKDAKSKLDTELKRLRLDLEDARAEIVGKEASLQKTYRGLKMLKKCSEDERSAKEDAQQELSTVTQRLLQLMRRDRIE